MGKKFWFLGILILFISLFFDAYILGYIADNRIIELNEIIKNFSIITNGFFSLIIVGLIVLYFKRKLIFRFLIGFGITAMLVYLIKIAVRRTRPFDVVPLIFNESGFSFPSGHAVFAFFCLGFIWKDFKKFRYFWLIMAIMIAFARSYVGIHYLSDLIGAMLIGLFLGDFFRKKKIFKL